MTDAMYFHDTDVANLVEKINGLYWTEDDIIFLMVAENSSIDLQEFVDALNEKNIPFAGGVFPGVIYGDQKYGVGVVASVLPQIAQPTIVTGLHSETFAMPPLPQFSAQQTPTALVLVDGLTNYIAAFMDRLFLRLDNQVRYIGGGAGSLSFQPMPCLFDPSGVYQDAAIVLWLKSSLRLGVRHGWYQMRGPLIASSTDGTVVKQLSRKPALDIYTQTIKAKTGITLTEENLVVVKR